MSANTELRDLQIRHAIHLLRYGNGLERKIVALLNSVDADLVEKIAGRLAVITADGVDPGPATTARITAMLDEVRAINTGVYQRVQSELEDELTGLAANEGEFQAMALHSSLGLEGQALIPSPPLLRSIVTETPIQGELLSSFVRGMELARIRRMEQAVRIGMVEGQGVEAIVRRIKGTKAANYTDGVLDISRRSARSIVRTSVNHVSNQAAQATWKANDDLVKGWQFVATLDSRTTIICASLDGQVFDVGTGPVPPRHIACRSITTAVTKSFSEMGVKRRREFSADRRASVDGQIAAPVRFDGWLRAQSEERQIAVLGATRARLWREGKLDLGDFIRDNREVISLDELRRLHPGMDAVNPEPKVKPPIRRGERVRTTPAPDFRGIAATDEIERNYVLENGRRDGIEYLVAYDSRTGTVYQRSSGGRDYVNFAPELEAALSDEGNAVILHHNHPSSSSLSFQDLQMATHFKGARGIWAHGHNGSAYYAERGEFELKKRTVDAIGENLRGKLQREINASRIAPREASLMHNHLMWLALHDTGQIAYRAELAGESLAIFNRYEALFREMLEELK